MAQSTDYINSTDYKTLESRIKDLEAVLEENKKRLLNTRRLRYGDVDVEAERASGRLAPDEVLVNVHTIDTNIGREQVAYVQYITQPSRAVITKAVADPSINMALLDEDLTTKLRFKEYQMSMFSWIDGTGQDGYGIMEVVYDETKAGHVGHEFVQHGDFAFVQDTKDLQAVEMCARAYHYSRSKLKDLCGNPNEPDPDNDWNKTEVDKLIEGDPDSSGAPNESADIKDRSLFRILKVMFKSEGKVMVGWAKPDKCKDWLRKPRALYLGDRAPKQYSQLELLQAQINKVQLESTEPKFETGYPYILFPYKISENDTIAQLRGRTFLDQDTQVAVSSLLSSTVTKARRSSALYFSRDEADPNDSSLEQKPLNVKPGVIINQKIREFQLSPPDPSMFGAIQTLVTINQTETSQLNFATNNRKDSRKTAEEIKTSKQDEMQLSGVKVVLLSIALTRLYDVMVRIIKARVLAGIIKVRPEVLSLYQQEFVVKPAGDVDVIEKQQLIASMVSAWPVMQNTPAATEFLIDMIRLMFPQFATKYEQAIRMAQQQQQSAQAQQMQQMMALLEQLSAGIINLSHHKEMFSDVGQLHAWPVVQQIGQSLEKLSKQIGNK